MSTVGVDAAVAQERPVAPDFFHLLRIALDDQNLFLVVRRLGENPAERIADERSAPEFETLVRRPFEADAIYRRDIDAVGDRVRALGGAPGIVLRRAVLSLLRGVPADRGRIEQNVRARKRGEARGFGIPLVPADERRDAAELRIERAESRDRRE